jgi:hypothetical protein
MTNLQERAIAAHGGLPKWGTLSTVRAHLTQGGVLWALKGQEGTIDDIFVKSTCTGSSPVIPPSGDWGTTRYSAALHCNRGRERRRRA